MGRPYSQDLRERVVDAAGSTSRRQAAKRFGVGAATAVRWMTALATTGTVAARPQGRARGSKLDAYEAFVRGLIAGRDDITLSPWRRCGSACGRNTRSRSGWGPCGASSTPAA